MPVKSTKLGPGTLIFDPPAGTTLDVSCQVQGLTVTWDKKKADDVRMLCGDVKPGVTTYHAKLDGTVDQDLSDVAGLVFWSWQARGTVTGFTYVPNNTAGAAVTGQVIVDPLDVGGDTGNADMTSKFTWDCVGNPVLAGGWTPNTLTSTDDTGTDDTDDGAPQDADVLVTS